LPAGETYLLLDDIGRVLGIFRSFLDFSYTSLGSYILLETLTSLWANYYCYCGYKS